MSFLKYRTEKSFTTGQNVFHFTVFAANIQEERNSIKYDFNLDIAACFKIHALCHFFYILHFFTRNRSK